MSTHEEENMTFFNHVARMWKRMKKPPGEFQGVDVRVSGNEVVISGCGSSNESAVMKMLAERLYKNGDCLEVGRVVSSVKYDHQGEPEDEEYLCLRLVPAPGRFTPHPKPRPVERGMSLGVMANLRLQAGLNENLLEACDDVLDQIERFA